MMNRVYEEFVKFGKDFEMYMSETGLGMFFTYITIIFLGYVVLHEVYVVYTVPLAVTFLLFNLVFNISEDSHFMSFVVFLAVFLLSLSPLIIPYYGSITVEELYTKALFSGLSFWGFISSLVLCFVFYPVVRIYIKGENLLKSFSKGLRYVFYSPWENMFLYVFSTGIVVLPVMLAFLIFRLFPSLNFSVLGLPISLYIGGLVLTIFGMTAEAFLTEKFDNVQNLS